MLNQSAICEIISSMPTHQFVMILMTSDKSKTELTQKHQVQLKALFPITTNSDVEAAVEEAAEERNG